MIRPSTPEEVRQAIKQTSTQLLARGGASKSALSTPSAGETTLELSSLTGVLEYSPDEFTFTALAGTPLAEVSYMLAENRQWMPFDPPLVARGATLGGTLASGLSGPGRYRFGGVRDFVLGVQWVSGAGELLRGGGRVVKNVSGFDFPKMMVGSLGSLGVVTEVTFKVFPIAEQFGTIEMEFDGLNEAVAALNQLSGLPLDIFALELQPPARLLVRLCGQAEALSLRLRHLTELVGRGEIVLREDENALWEQLLDFAWLPASQSLLKVPVTPSIIPDLDARLAHVSSERRYSVGGNLAWVGWSGDIREIDAILSELELGGMWVLGPAAAPWVGIPPTANAFARHVKRALDKEGRFLEL
jgi:glycolate oxidase FAD binding subunit